MARSVKHVLMPVCPHPWRCIDLDGTGCPQLRVTRMGGAWTCKLYCEQGDHGEWRQLPERDGCLAKLPECLAGISAAHTLLAVKPS
jgi:hypothetical protein